MSDSHIRYKVESWDSLQHLFKVKKINDHTLHFLAAFESKLDYSRLWKSLAVAAEAFPLLKCRFNEDGRRPYWESCSYTEDEMLTLIETEDVNSAVNQFLVSEVDELTGPQIKLGVIRNTQADTLVILMNHMLCDAAGFKDYLYLLSSIYNNIEKDSDFHPPVSGSRRLSQINQMFSLKDRMKILFSKNDMSAHDPARLQLEGDLNNPFIEIRSIPEEIFLKLKEYARRHNATINDMILSAYIRTLYETFGYAFPIPSTVDLRKYLPGHKAEGICNLCTNLTCDIGPDIGISFEETLEKVRDSMNKEKSSNACMKSITMLEKVFDVLPYRLAESIVNKSFNNAPIAFTNIGIIEKKRFYFDELKIKNAYMTGSVKYSPYFQLAVSTFDNKPALSVNLFGSKADQDKISVFLDKVVLELYGV
ncbi:hypothetical protein [Lacrimispora sp. 38-1]|uniref:hypothetical protein n=1 Tax=Lacrimispora sp. 38-1 TaxID=3125778 RepID=UPI003CF87FF5